MRHTFSIHIVGFSAQEVSDLIVGGDPRFSRVMVDEVPEIVSLVAGPPTLVPGHPTLWTRAMHYELDPMVWEPLKALLKVAAPGMVRYTDTVVYRSDLPGWDFATECAATQGMLATTEVRGGGRVYDDGPLGARIEYDVLVVCQLPLVGRLVERVVADTFERTCQRLPQVMQRYFCLAD
jgi:hypothetical protein